MASELRLPRINTVIISGRLTRDVELRYTPNGTPVAKFSLAFDRSYQKDGEWMQDTSYIDVVTWSKRGEQCAESLHKGSAVIVEGYLQTRSYVDKDNQNRKIAEIVASKVNFLEKTEPGEDVKSETSASEESKGTADITNDDIPF
ncbi:MAG: single-stranded DNA-binding protein [Candidatus Cloacimonetes bacterium]|nr:single-stranded DNA-binding protein [Candidatus Cloacimonadota bacterium]